MSPDKTDEIVTSLIEPWMKPRRPVIDEAIERYFPKQLDTGKLEWICGTPTYQYDLAAINDGIYAPGWELLSRGGKRWRPLLMMLTIEALGKDPHEFSDFLVIPEVVHNGTLIIDDIEDSSEMRRGRPCIHKLPQFGIDVALNAGNTMYYDPLLPLIKLRHRLPAPILLDVYETYAQEMINISHGQGTDIWWHKGGKGTPTVPQYLQMCAYKTGTLARMSTRIGAILAGADRASVDSLGRFAESIAIAFQIQDDVLNLRESVGKEFGEDIKEGKRSLLVIRAIEKLPRAEAVRLQEILDSHTGQRNLIAEAIQLIQRTDALEYCRGLGLRIIEDSWKGVEASLSSFSSFSGFSPDGKSGLRAIADYLIQRSN